FEPEPAEAEPRVVGNRALAGERLRDRNADPLGQRRELRFRLRVADAAARDDERPHRRPQELGRLVDPTRRGRRPLDPPDALGEERARVVERVRLHILRQRQHDRARLDRRRQHAHRLRQRRQQLLRADDPVEEARYRPEAVVDADVARTRMLELLQHRPLVACRVRVARQQQHRQPVDRRAGPDRRRARERRPAARRLRERGRRVHHRLLVMALEERQLAAELVERLPDAVHVAVTEDPEYARDQPPHLAVALRELRLQVADERLRRRQPLAHPTPWMTTVFSSVISSIPYLGPSLPTPLALSPPYGIRSARHSGVQLIWIEPQSTARANRSALVTFEVKTPAPRPYGPSFARAIASSTSAAGVTATAGPNSSSRESASPGSTSATTVGSTTAPERPPPVRRRAPAPTAAPIGSSTRSASRSLISAESCVPSANGSPTAIASTRGTSASRKSA